MTLRSHWNRARPVYFSPGLLLAAVLAAAAFPPSQAQAREPGIVGGSGLPEVEVDLSATDQAEPARGQRRLLMPGTKMPPSGRIVLTPPHRLDKLKAAPKLTPPGAPGKTMLRPPKSALTPPAPSGMAAVPAPKPSSAAKPSAPPSVAAVASEPKPAAKPPPPRTKKRVPVDSKPLAPPAESAVTKGAKAEPPVAAKPPEPEPAAKEPAAAPPPPPADDGAAEAVAVAPAAGSGDGSQQLAALPPAPAPIEPDRPLAIGFETGSAELDGAASLALTRVADALNEDAELRLQIVAYATGSDANASQARRMSLSRALAVRSHLIDKGVRSTRMDVRALGNKFKTAPGDRVDLVVVRP
jgi:outer membrane protein OmpA-like peptidoglycan-associated protein